MLGSNIVSRLHRWYKSRHGSDHEKQWYGEDSDFYRLSWRLKHEAADVPMTVLRLEEEPVIGEGGLTAVVRDFELVLPLTGPSEFYTEEEIRLIMRGPADLDSGDQKLRLLNELYADSVIQHAFMPFDYKLRANIDVLIDEMAEAISFENLRLAHYNPYYRKEEVSIDYSFGPDGSETQQLLERIKEGDSFLSSMRDDEIIESIVGVFEPINEQIVRIAYEYLAPPNFDIPTELRGSPRRRISDIDSENIP